MKARPDLEAWRQVLPDRSTGQQRRRVADRDPGGVAALLDELLLEIRRIALLLRLSGLPLTQNPRPFAVKVDEVLCHCLPLFGIGAQKRGPRTSPQDSGEFPARLNASPMDTFMPWPALGLCV